jgi:hypothetical protein
MTQSEYDNNAGSVIRGLLTEYSQRLDQMRADVGDLRTAFLDREPTKRETELLANDYHALRQACEKITRAGEVFARGVSQRIEHAIIDDIIRLELQLRLADFEANLLRTKMVVERGRPF